MLPKFSLIILIAWLFLFELRAQDVQNLYPAWSPAGKQIAFCSNRNGTYKIFVMNADGTNSQQVTNGTGNDYWPSWADARTIVFDSDRMENEEIFSIGTNGKKLKQLTFDTAAYDGVASCSRSGTIAFDSNREPDKLADVWTMDKNGKRQQQLTMQPFSTGHPSWSWSGDKIIFKVRLKEKEEEIFEMNSDGSALKQITTNHCIHLHPSYSPNGNKIAYASNQDGDFDIYVMDIVSKQIEKITNNTSSDYRPTFSPNGRLLLYCSKESGRWQIMVYDFESSTSRQLTH